MFVLLYLSVALVFASAAGDGGKKKQNLWIAHIKGGEEVAKGVARDVGLTYQDKGVGSFKDHYIMTREDHPDIEPDDLTRSLVDHEHVRWARQQLISEHSKYHMAERSEWENFDDKQEQADMNWFLKSVNETEEVQDCKLGPFACVEFSSHLLDYLKHLGQTDVNKLGTFSTKPVYDTTLDSYTGPTIHLESDPKKLSAYAFKFNDPEWRKQWYMQDYRTYMYPVMDHNIVPVLNRKITGLSVTVGVIGDGVKDHPDLEGNFETSISYDFCEGVKGSAVPTWTWSLAGYSYDTKGTSSAGVIAMKSGNNICGVGIAPDARIAGLKITGCDSSSVSDREASAFTYNLHDIDIYCNTWTNDDELGKNIVEMSYTVEHAYKRGIKTGRKEKGAIYVFPSGSNKKNNNCAANGFLNNPYVITIGSAASDGKRASYSERCTAIFAAAYSGEKYIGTEDIITINADGGCSRYDMNKPIASAMACGIFALVLQYKPSLTYRDMMHLIAMTAEVAPLANNMHSWYRNGRGFWVSSDFGFGLLNAENMINLATDWKTVPDKNICVLHMKLDEPMYFDHTEKKRIKIDARECRGPNNGIVYLEHVELSSTIDYYYRGAVYMNLTSPAGTNSEILEPRIQDYYTEGIQNWNIMSLHNWGENPKGDWEIVVMACRIRGADNPHGYIKEFTLTLHGTQERPAHYERPRKYAAFRLPNGDTNRYV